MTAETMHRMCLGKSRYPTQAKARRYADKCASERGVPIRVYACFLCGGWHLTSKVERAR